MPLVQCIGAHVPGAERHALRVASLAGALAACLGVAEHEIPYIRAAALLHDAGKLSIPAGIFARQAALANDEWALVKRHPAYGRAILSAQGGLHPILDAVHFHHERWDGSGYPLGLRRAEIPLSARIVAVADVWDALLEERPYKPAWSRSQAVWYLLSQAGQGFDPVIALAFLKMQTEGRPV